MIRTPEQYLASLRDGRVIYLHGKQVADITTNPLIRGAIEETALCYTLCHDPKWRDLFTFEENGERAMFLWKQPRTAEDLIRRRNVYITALRIGAHMPGMGPDALAAAGVVASRMDRRMGTHYLDAVEDYRKHLAQADPAITGAMTDVKGDRGLHPMSQKQHQDFYVRVVDRKKDGIVVRGAKMHISATPTCNEIIVLPCRAHREEDKDCAVVFATPINAKGITLITSPASSTEVGEEAQWNWPVTGRHGGISECMIVFDDVFVPWNRVFMCGEWQFSRDIAWTFGVFHRLFGTTHKVISLENTVGVAALMAEYNGIESNAIIRRKLAWLAMHCQMNEALSQMACEHPDFYPDIGLAAPNLMYTNMAKFMFADEQAHTSKLLADITGGLTVTVFNHSDWKNPEERRFIEKYLAGKDGVPTEHRLRAIRMVKDMTDHNFDALVINAEGSLAAQEMAMYAAADWEKYKAIARRVAGIPGWEEHPFLKNLPRWPAPSPI